MVKTHPTQIGLFDVCEGRKQVIQISLDLNYIEWNGACPYKSILELQLEMGMNQNMHQK